MTEIMRQLSRQEQWVVVELNPERNLLEDLAAKLNSDRMLAGVFRKARNIEKFLDETETI